MYKLFVKFKIIKQKNNFGSNKSLTVELITKLTLCIFLLTIVFEICIADIITFVHSHKQNRWVISYLSSFSLCFSLLWPSSFWLSHCIFILLLFITLTFSLSQSFISCFLLFTRSPQSSWKTHTPKWFLYFSYILELVRWKL